jgi:AsmA protein
MKKHWLMITGIAFVALVLIVVALPFLININSFRPQLEARASAALGRKVKLGNLSLSILRGTLIANDIEVADDPAFSPSDFLTAKSVDFEVELKPLIFSRQVNVIGVVVEQPKITLIRADNGAWNFSSLGEVARKNQSQLKSKMPAITVARFGVNDGTLVVKTGSSDQSATVYQSVQVEVSDFSSVSPFHFKLTTLLPGGASASLLGTAGPLSSPDASNTPLDATVKINNLHLATYSIVPAESGIEGLVNLDETFHSDGSKITLQGTFNGTGIKLSPKGSPSPSLVSIRNAVEVDLASRSGTLSEADISIGKALLHATGTFQLEGKQAEQTAVNLQVNGTDMPIDEFQAMFPALNIKMPMGSHLRGGTVTAKLSASGPLSELVIKGTISAANTTLVGYNLGSQLGSISSLAGKAVSAPDTSFRSASFDLTATAAGIKLDNIKVDTPAVGPATGSGVVSPTGELKFAMLAYPTHGMAGALTKMASVGSGQGRVPVAIVGTAEKPVYVADVGATTRIMVSQTAKGVASVPVHAIQKLFGKKKPADSEKNPDDSKSK